MDIGSGCDDDGLSPAQLQQINRLATLARMVGGLAHELNNSLQVVSGLVELLSDRPDLPAEALVRVQKIGGQADKATTAIRQVLGFSREGAAGRASLDLGALVEQAVALRRYNLGRAGITVAMDMPQTTPVRVTGDEREITQLLVNLVLNAEEALTGQVQRHLRLAVAADGGRAQVVVTDTGHGVPPEMRDQIFEPFFTTRTTERAVGLGLPVARALAARHGGTVVLTESEPGATTFVVELPAG